MQKFQMTAHKAVGLTEKRRLRAVEKLKQPSNRKRNPVELGMWESSILTWVVGVGRRQGIYVGRERFEQKSWDLMN